MTRDGITDVMTMKQMIFLVVVVLVAMMPAVAAQGPAVVEGYTGATQLDAPPTREPTDLASSSVDEDFTGTWTQMTASAEWSKRSSHTSVALSDGSIVLMGGADANTCYNDVWRSTDQGATWTLMTVNAGWAPRYTHTSVVLPDDSIVLMGGYGYGGSPRYNDVWRSTDRGATWTQMTANAGWSGRELPMSVVLSDGSIILMGGDDGGSLFTFSRKNDVWRSTDQGATWTRLTANAGWNGRFGHNSVVALSDDTIILIGGVGRNWYNDVWKSTDQGATWTRVTADAEWTKRSGHVAVALSDDSIILMGGNDANTCYNDIWRSTDQGATWTQITANVAWPPRTSFTSVVLPDDSIVLMGGYFGSTFLPNVDSDVLNDVWRLKSVIQSSGTDIYNLKIFETTPKFSWSNVPGADNYRLNINKVTRKNNRNCGENTLITPVFNSKENGIIITSPHYQLPAGYALDPYAIYVWNYAAEKDGTIIGDYSEWEYFTVVDRNTVLTNVPYIHQVYDTYQKDNSFFGDDACGPTSAVMVLAYHGKLSASAQEVDYPEKHTTVYGKYVSNNYEYKEVEFLGGAYNYWITAENTNQVYNIIDYLKLHELDAGFTETPSKNEARSLVKREIDNGNPVIARAKIDGNLYYAVIVGYQEKGDDFLYIVNDPIGNRNYPLYYPDNVLWGDYTGMYVPYTYEKMGLDASTRGLVWIHPEDSGKLNAQFKSDQRIGKAPLTVQFTDTSTGSPTSWSWDFGDGETSTDQNPVHIYRDRGEYDGRYDVNLTVNRGSASDTITKVAHIVVGEPSFGLNLALEYRNCIQLESTDSVEILIQTTGNTGLPKTSTITIETAGREPVTVHGDEYRYSFVPERSGTYTVTVCAVSDDDGIERTKEATIEVIDGISFAKKRAEHLKSVANAEIDQAKKMAAERAVDTLESIVIDITIGKIYDEILPYADSKSHSVIRDYCYATTNIIHESEKDSLLDIIGDVIFSDSNSYTVALASEKIENIYSIGEKRKELGRSTKSFGDYIEAHPDRFRERDRVDAYINMYSSGIKSVVENHIVVDFKIGPKSFVYSYPEAYCLYDTVHEYSRFIKPKLGAAVVGGVMLGVLSGVGTTVVVALLPAAVKVVKSISSFDTFASVALSLLLMFNVPIIADDVVHEHQNSILGVENALSGISSDFVALSASDTSVGRTAQITSSGDVFIIGPSGKVKTILLGGGHYTPTDSGTYRAYSYNHDDGPFTEIEECDIAVQSPDVAINATYNVTGDLTLISITVENHEDTPIDGVALTTWISDNDGNFVEIYDESFDLNPSQNVTYEYEIDSPAFNAFYIAETVLSINYSAVLDSANFIVESEGGNEAETAVILSIDDSQIFDYGEAICINLTIRSFKDALPVTLEVPEFKYSTTEDITGEEVVSIILPGGEPDDYMTGVYLYSSSGAIYDADVIRFTVQAEGTGFLSIETNEILFPAGETVTAPLTFTDAGLNDLDGDIVVQIRTPENEIFDAAVTGSSGNYQLSFNPPVNGTYVVTAEAHKDGYYIYDDQATFISGEMSPLELAVGADEEALYVNVTANGLPISANVTMATNDTEVSRAAVSGIATFPREENYCLTAKMLFFAPAEFSHISPAAEFYPENNRTITGRNVLFNASESHDSDGWIVEHLWDFGDGHEETTTSSYTLHLFNASGRYMVNLTVIDNDGLSSSVTKEVTVIDRNIPRFDLSEQSIYVNGTGDVSVRATDLDEVSWLRAAIEYDPDIVQAVGVTGEDIALTSYIEEGVIIVEANATVPLSGSANIASITFKGLHEGSSANNISAVCRDVDGYLIEPVVSGNTISVLYGAPPVANFTSNVTAGPVPLAVQFTDLSTGDPIAWSWSFGDGNTSAERNPTHTYTLSGTYTVTLTVSTATDSATLSRPDYITVTVKGDFNGNGEVDIGDVSKVAYMVVGKEPADLAADFNGNGAVDIGDAAKIAYYFVGKIETL